VEDGSPCCDWVGEEGAGHFVKMVHNGIEYGDMQLIAEVSRTSFFIHHLYTPFSFQSRFNDNTEKIHYECFSLVLM
jgi:hypothetical protein